MKTIWWKITKGTWQRMKKKTRKNDLSKKDGQAKCGKSTISALSHLLTLITDSLEKSRSAAVALCDLSKAFDCVNHQTLLAKLELYGIRGLSLQLLTSYLTNRRQCIRGSVLGPLLFIIYTNDFYYYIKDKADCVLFADDTTLTCSNSVSNLATEKVTEAVKNAEVWFNSNYLKLNQQKTQQALFTSSNATYDSTSFRLLGLEIDSSLRWTSQIDSICKKLSSSVSIWYSFIVCTNICISGTASPRSCYLQPQTHNRVRDRTERILQAEEQILEPDSALADLQLKLEFHSL
ncbi:uncharacterized protein LOC135128187 [Zophobas morio]|uniref:uncharacterized protein LOC135128187 n=1 Tax=Zophobas morio TaxID=2755281 RepID=UPI003083DF16